MTPGTNSPPSSTSAVATDARRVGLARRFALLLICGAGIVLWLQFPNGLWPWIGMLLLCVSGPLVTPASWYRQPVPPGVLVLLVGALLLLILIPVTAYYNFGWSLNQHPRLIRLCVGIWGAFIWLVAAVYQFRLVLAGRRSAPAA